jgi:hypothetical protein
MKDRVVRLRGKYLLYFLIKSIIYPIIVYLIILGILVLIRKLSIEDIFEYQNTFIVVLLITLGVSIYLLLEYSLLSLGKKVIISDNTITLYIGEKLKYKKTFSEISSYSIYGETNSFHFFPWGSFSYCSLLFNDGNDLVINCLQSRKLDGILEIDSTKRRNVFPSLLMHKIIRWVS